MSAVECGHAMGCQCEDVPLVRVGCGRNVLAACRAGTRLWSETGRNPINGAWTHVFADLFRELEKDGFVLARKTSEEES